MRLSELSILLLLFTAPFALGGTEKPWKAYKPIPNEYIVVLTDQTHANIDAVANALTQSHHGKVLAILKNGVKAFGATMSAKDAEALALNPLVDHVEENGEAELAVNARAASLRIGTPDMDRLGHRALVPGTLSNHCPTQSTYFLCEYGADPSFWHLDRLDNRGPLYGYRAYAFTSNGAGVRVYVLDTGVLATHEQFDGQVEAGATFGDAYAANNPCGGYADFYGPGHGTAVASVIAGTTNGVAKNVTIIPVKVWNCDWNSFNHFANPPTSTLWWCWGLDWILGDMNAHPNNRAVVNISGGIFLPNNELCNGTPCVPAFENNVNLLIQNRIVVVTSADNQSNANCAISPARMGYGGTPGYMTPHHTITVGGSDELDHLWVRTQAEMVPGCTPPRCVDTGSNTGPCVDIYAPAHNIQHLAHLTCNNCYRTELDQLSGTSFAAPIVTGIVARLLESHNDWTPEQVWTYIRDQANHPFCFDFDAVNNVCRNDRLVYISPFD